MCVCVVTRLCWRRMRSLSSSIPYPLEEFCFKSLFSFFSVGPSSCVDLESYSTLCGTTDETKQCLFFFIFGLRQKFRDRRNVLISIGR